MIEQLLIVEGIAAILAAFPVFVLIDIAKEVKRNETKRRDEERRARRRY